MNWMHKQIERLINVLNANFGEAEILENQHDGTHKRDDGEIIPDYQLAKDLEGCLTVTIHLANKGEGKKMVKPNKGAEVMLEEKPEVRAMFEESSNTVRSMFNAWASMDKQSRGEVRAMLEGWSDA